MSQAIPILGYVGIQGVLLFASAGRIDWPLAWLCLIVHALFSAFVTLRGDRRMLNARGTRESGAKRWDIWLASSAAFLVGPASLVVAGLDFGRLHWSPQIPLVIRCLAFLLFSLGMAAGAWSMVTNRFFTKYVHVQKSQGHYAVDSGPYAIVRHPGYASAAFAFAALPIALGSLWAFATACLGIALLFVRTYFEDETLKQELPGYRVYAVRTQWRLFPGIW